MCLHQTHPLTTHHLFWRCFLLGGPKTKKGVKYLDSKLSLSQSSCLQKFETCCAFLIALSSIHCVNYTELFNKSIIIELSSCFARALAPNVVLLWPCNLKRLTYWWGRCSMHFLHSCTKGHTIKKKGKSRHSVMVWCGLLTLGLLLPLLRLKGPVQLNVYYGRPADFHTWVPERALMSILMSYQILVCYWLQGPLLSTYAEDIAMRRFGRF